jgi:branched-chain amino acid transport system substrate-binding protein
MTNRERLILSTCAGLVFIALAATPAARAAETKGPVTDPVGVITIPKGAPIQFGGY